MNRLFLLIFLFIGQSAFSQPGWEEPQPQKFGFFDSEGIRIERGNKEWSIRFNYHPSDETDEIVWRTSEEETFSEGKYELKPNYAQWFVIEVVHGDRKMTVHTQYAIDSLPFREGEYLLDFPATLLLNCRFANGTRVVNFDLDQYKLNSAYKPVNYKLRSADSLMGRGRDSCFTVGRRLENKHGGYTWAQCACIERYQYFTKSDWPPVQEKIEKLESIDPHVNRVDVFPILRTNYIRHDFYPDNGYPHFFYESKDECKSWTPFLTVKGEWYVNLVFFPGYDKIAVDGRYFVLLSDYEMKDWYYYPLDLSDWDEPVPPEKLGDYKSLVGLLLKNSNWSENEYINFYFEKDVF